MMRTGGSATSLSRVAQRLRARDLLVSAQGEATIAGITDDSRTVAPGDLFCAWRGESVDAHQFVPAAVRAGSTASSASMTTSWLPLRKSAG